MRVRLVVPTSRRTAPERGHDVGDAEAVADFDQFAARDDGFAAGGKFVEREEHGSGIVVDGDAGRTQQAFEQAPAWTSRLPRRPAAMSYSRLE